jgi:pimeloyl-ACP methyl ester carboxylesterase
MVEKFDHKFVQTNGIRIHYVERGAGPLVVLCHGFPESWYSWRHQIIALAEAGFHVVAADQRGYGQTDRPEPVAAYNTLQMAGDAVGLVNALGEKSAVIFGHDWGAPVAWYAALLRPDLFLAMGLLSVPGFPRTPMRPSAAAKAAFGDQVFYQQYFQQVGRAENDFGKDPRRALLGFLYALSGEASGADKWRFAFKPTETILDSFHVPDKLPSWLTEEDLEFYTNEFKRTGFVGGLNWYRNIDQTWELVGFLEGATVRQPALFITGDKDPVIEMYADWYKNVAKLLPNLRVNVTLPGVGHWTQQERPAEVSGLMIDFLKGLAK